MSTVQGGDSWIMRIFSGLFDICVYCGDHRNKTWNLVCVLGDKALKWTEMPKLSGLHTQRTESCGTWFVC